MSFDMHTNTHHGLETLESNNAGTLWCGKTGQMRGLKLQSEGFTSRFLMTLYARPDIPQLSQPNLYKNTYLNKPEGLSPIHKKTNNSNIQTTKR